MDVGKERKATNWTYKGLGQGIMVSDFVDEFNGLLKLAESFSLISSAFILLTFTPLSNNICFIPLGLWFTIIISISFLARLLPFFFKLGYSNFPLSTSQSMHNFNKSKDTIVK